MNHCWVQAISFWEGNQVWKGNMKLLAPFLRLYIILGSPGISFRNYWDNFGSPLRTLALTKRILAPGLLTPMGNQVAFIFMGFYRA